MNEQIETLDLVLKHKWYDMIDKGEKPEEYRMKIPHWIKRIGGCDKGGVCKHHCCGQCKHFKPHHKRVRFHRGYTSTTMLFEIGGVFDEFGEVRWGAHADIRVYVILLGKRLNVATSEQIENNGNITNNKQQSYR